MELYIFPTPNGGLVIFNPRPSRYSHEIFCDLINLLKKRLRGRFHQNLYDSQCGWEWFCSEDQLLKLIKTHNPVTEVFLESREFIPHDTI